jgi:microcystin-dependent protein
MANPYLGEIRIFTCNFAPVGWAMCNGQLLPIIQNQALFSLLGTQYGGDGQTTFALPNLQGRVGIHMGTLAGGGTYTIGQIAGEENHTLLASEMPAHGHLVKDNSNAANSDSPANTFPASTAATGGNCYSNVTDGTTMNPGMIAPAGGSLPHNNLQPYLVLNYCISLVGIFPSRS